MASSILYSVLNRLSQHLRSVNAFPSIPLSFNMPFSSPAWAGGLRRGWDAKEDNDGLHWRVDIPGLGNRTHQETIKQAQDFNNILGDVFPVKQILVGNDGCTFIYELLNGSVEETTLTIEGEGGRYSSRIVLSPKFYKTDAIKAEMKNGVLKVFVPKVKEDERKDVLQVQLD